MLRWCRETPSPTRATAAGAGRSTINSDVRGHGPGAPVGRSRTVANPSLVTISHAIERFALASDRDAPLAVIAMFQRLSYFHTEAHLYGRIAGNAALTLVGLVQDAPPALPPGVSHVLLGEGEDLAREWSVTVLSPRAGATVVARDLESIDGSARTLESGRLFSGWWSFRRSDAFGELVRLRDALAGRLPPAQIRAVDHVLAQVVAVPGVDTDERTDAVIDLLVAEVSALRRQGDHIANRLDEVAGVSDERDPRTGLPNSAFLHRWTSRSASGTLPVGLVLLRVHDLALANDRHGFRAELALLQAVARVLRARLTRSDRAVRLGREEFLLVLPGSSRARLVAVAEQARADVGLLARAYPFIPAAAAVAVMSTRSRPLPVPTLWKALDDAVRAGLPTVLLPGS